MLVEGTIEFGGRSCREHEKDREEKYKIEDEASMPSKYFFPEALYESYIWTESKIHMIYFTSIRIILNEKSDFNRTILLFR